MGARMGSILVVDEDDTARAIAANTTLSKPFARQELINAVSELLS